jgi:uncharacterized protein YndB with AHSA1/START domain
MKPYGTPSEPIAKDVYIAAPPHIVYSFLTEPAKIAVWFGSDSQLDPRRGGIFRMRFDRPDGTNVARGAYLEAVPYSKVAFTWGFEREGHAVPVGSTLVEITLEPEGDGTRLRLIHRDLSGEQRELHDAGWDHYVARLKIAAEGGEPEPDPLVDESIQHR